MAYCRNQAQADAEVDEFIKTSIGQHFTGPWGNQCARYSQDAARILFGLKDGRDAIGWGDAVDQFANASAAYFDKIANDPNDPDLLPRRGDFAIYWGKLLWGSYYGHVGIVSSRTSAAQTLAQEDGAAPPTRLYPDGYNYSHKPAHYATFAYVGDPGVGNVRGWLRPKWQKVIYTGADKRGYGTTPVAPASPVVSTVRDFIDVSDWQPGDVVRNVKTDAVVIKATEGVSWKSAHMADHIAAARAKGIPYMLYAFARASKNGSDAEAAWFLRAARPYLLDPLFSGLVLDWEEDSVAHYALWASDFLAYLRKHAPGVHLVIYTRAGFLPAKGWRSEDKKAPVWLAAYGSDKRMNGYATDFAGAPRGSNGFTVSAWQYSQHGYLSGYASNLDLNRALTPAMWPTRAPATAQQIAKKTEPETWEEAIMALTEKDRQKLIDDIATAVTKKTSPQTVRELLAAKIGGTDQAEGEMTLAESWKWDRHERAMNAGQRAEVTRIAKGVDTLAMGVLRILGKLTPSTSGSGSHTAVEPTTKKEV